MIFEEVVLNHYKTLKIKFMAKVGNTLATLLIGTAIGVAVGYVLATDEETRKDDIEKLKKSLDSLKSKLMKKGEGIEEEIYHS